MLINFDESYSVGNALIDTHHKELVAILNSLFMAMRDRVGKAKTQLILHQLIDYTKYHFSAEEKLFEPSSYPKTLEHKKLHRDFIRKCEDWEYELQIGKPINVDMLDFLTNWLINHIKQVDKEMSSYLR